MRNGKDPRVPRVERARGAPLDALDVEILEVGKKGATSMRVAVKAVG